MIDKIGLEYDITASFRILTGTYTTRNKTSTPQSPQLHIAATAA